MLETSTRQRILVDQDNVLADFDGGFLIAWQQCYPKRFFVPLNERRIFHIRDDYPVEFKKDVENIYSSPGFIRNLPEIPGAVEALKSLRKLGHTIRIVTSPLSQYHNCVEEKYSWVEEHLGEDCISSIVLTKDKTEVRGDILIDDRPEIKGSLQPIWEHILFDQPYNKNISGKKRLTSWNNWQQIFQE